MPDDELTWTERDYLSKILQKLSLLEEITVLLTRIDEKLPAIYEKLKNIELNTLG